MGNLVGKIVLTGGPCAGKTTALSKIEQNLSEQGYQVYVVSESATELIKGGIKPFGENPLNIIEFQNLIINYQLSKEKIYEQATTYLPDNKKCVIIYDRGTLDNKAYINQKEFDKILNNYGLNELTIMDNYDMIIHLVTAADGKVEYYTLENNEARSETVEEAITLDKKTVNAWTGHRNLKIIDNSVNFEEKIEKVLNEINNLLGKPISLSSQRRYLIDLENSDLSFLNDDNCTQIDIEQTYLKKSENGFEKRLRKRTYNNTSTYYFTVKKRGMDGVEKIATDKKITEKEYLKILSEYEIDGSINKKRFSFIKNKQYLKLDVFENNLAILELNPTEQNKRIIIPRHLTVLKEVTCDENYNNYNLAKQKAKTAILK